MSNHLLVIDASLDNRIAVELGYRAREAVALSKLGIHRLEDPELLPELFVRIPDRSWILVTADDDMPEEWADVISWLKPTIATIDPRRKTAHNDDELGRDVVHRWAHVMQTQTARSIRRYRINSHGIWKPRRKKGKKRA